MHAKTRIADLGEVRIAFRAGGVSSGPALVLARSKGFDLSQWDTVLPLLPPGLRLPGLAIAGAADTVTPPDMVRELSGLIPAARLRLPGKCGPLAPIEHPEALPALSKSFFWRSVMFDLFHKANNSVAVFLILGSGKTRRFSNRCHHIF
tara:strand:+ start:3816 stop:4262 length:447 start_codon:yes stop_codon:yes gene_type:complete